MRVRIRSFALVENEHQRGARVIARFTAQLDHFQLSALKLMECPEKGYMIWSTRHVRLSMEGREEIMRKVMLKIEGAEASEG